MSERLQKSKGIVLTEYKGLTVAQISDLRKELKSIDAEYKVYKNTLVSIAAKGTPFEAANPSLTGPTGIAFGYDDPVAAAKKLFDFAGKNDKFKVKSFVMDGKLFDADETKAISKLPSRPVLLGMLAGVMQAPAQKLAGALNATIAQFAYALEAVKNKKTA